MDALAVEVDEVRAAAYRTARLAAAKYLVAGLAAAVTADPAEVVDVLMRRDPDSPQFEILAAVEQRWSLLVLRIVDQAVLRPAEAVQDARSRGVTWAGVGAALGVTASSACHRFGTTEAQQQVWRNPELHQHVQAAASRPGGRRPTR